MALKFTGGKAKEQPSPALNNHLHKMISQLGVVRDQVYQAGQKIPDIGVSTEEWNSILTGMKAFYNGVDELKRTLAMHLK